jgi:hypothetical protein
MRYMLKLLVLLGFGSIWAQLAQSHDMRGVANERDLIDVSDFDALVSNQPDAETRWVLSRSLLWNPGSTLTACFLNGSDSSKAAVLQDAEYLVTNAAHPANLRIYFDGGTAASCAKEANGSFKEDIRISFTDGCCSAYVGRLSHNAAVAKGPNVFLQEGLDPYRIKHELLHSLGFQHEHQRPDSPCHFNYEVIEQRYGWSSKMVDDNFKKMDKNANRLAMSTLFDPRSIMKYYFPKEFLVEGTSSPCYEEEAPDLSEADWEGLQYAYPMSFDSAKFKRALQEKRAVIELGPNPPAALSEVLQTLMAD